MNIAFALLFFVGGTIIGSFLSVLIYRIKHGKKGIVTGRSICTHCKKPLKFRYLVPLLSWLLLRGKCGYCDKKISSHYMLIELMTGLIFAAVFLNWNFLEITASTINPRILSFGIDWHMLQIFSLNILVYTLLAAIFFYDLLYKEIPDSLSITAIAIALAGGLAFDEPSIISMTIGALAIGGFFLVQFVLSKGKWIGGGDIRLGVLMGVFLGFEKGLLALVLAYFIGALVSISLLLQKKVNRKSEVAFGPFLIIGILIASFYGQEILDWYFSYAVF